MADLIGKQSSIPLNRFVRFEDAPYVPKLLDKIMSEAKRDRTEFGFAQSQTKNLPSDAASRREVGKVIREKMRKGYRSAPAREQKA